MCVSYYKTHSTFESLRAYFQKTVVEKEIESLKNVNLKLSAGDSLALIGQNGAGKTTLLKTLAGIYQPKSGCITSHGEISSLLNFSMGFIPADTGLRNVYRKLLFMGLTKQEVKAVIPEIMSFSELGNVIHSPVNTYSSGMRMRLAFATATCITPDILLMDEWISTGDRTFLEKVTNRIEKYVEESEIVVLASHSFNLLRSVCNKGAVLHKGNIKFYGGIEDALDYYQNEIVGRHNKTVNKDKDKDCQLEKAIFLLEKVRRNEGVKGMSKESAIVKAREIITDYLNE